VKSFSQILVIGGRDVSFPAVPATDDPDLDRFKHVVLFVSVYRFFHDGILRQKYYKSGV